MSSLEEKKIDRQKEKGVRTGREGKLSRYKQSEQPFVCSDVNKLFYLFATQEFVIPPARRKILAANNLHVKVREIDNSWIV